MVLPFSYVYGLSLLHTHIAAGGSLVLVNSLAFPNVAVDAMRRHSVTGFVGVPSTFALMLQRSNLERVPLPDLRYATQAGGPMPPARIAAGAILWQGRQLDSEEASGLYYYRNRMYSPTLGRFICRDPKGVWGDPHQMGNGQSAFGNNPFNQVDPLGMEDDFNKGIADPAKDQQGRTEIQFTEQQKDDISWVIRLGFKWTYIIGTTLACPTTTASRSPVRV